MQLRALLGTLVLGAILTAPAQAHSNTPTCACNEGLGEVANADRALLAGDSSRAAAARWYKQGRVHLQAGEYGDARACLEAAIQLDAQLIGAYKGLAKAWQLLREPKQEIAVLELAIENNPAPTDSDSSGGLIQNDARLWLYLDLASSLRRQGQRDQATRVLRKCLEFDPGFWSASRLLALHLDQARDLNGADRAIDHAFDHLCAPRERPGAETRRARALTSVIELYEELGRPAAAKRFLP